MTTEIAMSRLADLIIVITFFSFFSAGIGYMAADLIYTVYKKLRDWKRKRKEHQEESAE